MLVAIKATGLSGPAAPHGQCALLQTVWLRSFTSHLLCAFSVRVHQGAVADAHGCRRGAYARAPEETPRITTPPCRREPQLVFGDTTSALDRTSSFILFEGKLAPFRVLFPARSWYRRTRTGNAIPHIRAMKKDKAEPKKPFTPPKLERHDKLEVITGFTFGGS